MTRRPFRGPDYQGPDDTYRDPDPWVEIIVCTLFVAGVFIIQTLAGVDP